jgi:hypothetical protein
MAYTTLFSPVTAQGRVTSVHVGFVVNKMTLGQNFLQVLYFPLSTSFRQCPVPYTDVEPSHQLTAHSATAIRSYTAHPCKNLPLYDVRVFSSRFRVFNTLLGRCHTLSYRRFDCNATRVTWRYDTHDMIRPRTLEVIPSDDMRCSIMNMP